MCNKILLVEDDEFTSKAINIILTKYGYTVTIERNGKDALESLKSSKFDLVISDLMLPYASGLEFISKMRADMKLNIPVLVLSAITHENTITEGFEIGVDDYLKKPFNPSELTSRVHRLIEQSKR
ncbi:response regulator transcription factor [Chitinophaga sp. 212800010-3]|jgi:DNA-binding response OmpR family regulator|uniref:response regulator transcription factor n=1 Tax=unclassified Chitinophaga TaxID=2619133 RepID=UPI002DF1A44D|nr:Response regulator receiver domain-containing protein [Chitinophaga sp. 212800010-3]